MDTTLRDGEQTPQLAFTSSEKLHIARALLADVGVDRVEIASTGVSEGERQSAQRIVAWARDAGCLERIEMLGFCDGERSARWMAALGGGRMNLLLKGSEAHCRQQLGLSPEAHFAALTSTVESARALGVELGGAYLEDWSRGIVDSPDYVMRATRHLQALGVSRIFLADTLGCLAPGEVDARVRQMVRTFPGQRFEFHGHNDYGLATANALAAVGAGASGVHTSVNGLGERAGNGRLCEVVVALRDHLGVATGVDEAALTRLSTRVETFSGKLVADNAPIVGRDVFTQTAGVHADGDRKAGLYETRLSPERFGRTRDYALGKLSGRASLDQNLERLGIALQPEERDRLLARVVELGDQKRSVHPGDLPFLINDLLGREGGDASIADYRVTVGHGARGAHAAPGSHAARAWAEVTVRVGAREASASGEGSGGYAALMAALQGAAEELGLQLPPLSDFRVRIPPGGGTSALVETAIKWGEGAEAFTTVGVDPDQIGAAVIATEKMLRLTTGKRPARDRQATG